MSNLSSFIRYHADRTPAKVAILHGDRRISYASFYDDICSTAAWLAAQGVVAGDVVAVLMKNSAAFLHVAFAVSHLGAVFLPINFRLAREEVDFIIGNAEAKLLLVDEELKANASTHCATHVIGDAAQQDIAQLHGKFPPVAATPRLPTDLYRLMYTSGTTDHPKGVIHTYDNFYWKSAAHQIELGLDDETRLLVVGPLYHVGAFDLPGIAVLQQGGMLVILREFDPGAVLAAIEMERVTGAWLAPVMTTMLLSFPDRHRFDMSSLRWVVGGGERTPEQRISQFSAYFTNSRYIDAYGLTETCSGDTFMVAGRELEKLGSVGRPAAHVDISVRDEQGMELAEHHEGEICLRGPKVTPGYWRDPQRTEASFFDGWFRTGDVGYLDGDGFLFLTDRKKDMIISGGENIAASEVERVLHECEFVLEAAVIGVPDPRWGERPVAFVVAAPDKVVDIDALADHCRNRLASFKVPKHYVLRDTLPRNASGKILKRVLREEAAGAIG